MARLFEVSARRLTEHSMIPKTSSTLSSLSWMRMPSGELVLSIMSPHKRWRMAAKRSVAGENREGGRKTEKPLHDRHERISRVKLMSNRLMTKSGPYIRLQMLNKNGLLMAQFG